MQKYFLLIMVMALAGCEQGSSTLETTGNTGENDSIQEPSGRILQWGIYTLLRGGDIVDSARTTTGKAVSSPVITRDRETDRIPLIKDKYMAYQYRLSNLPGTRTVKLRRVLKHPPFRLPDPPTGGPWELTYAAALGNGATLDEWNRDDNHRQYYWLSFAMPFDKIRGPRWHDVMLYGSFSAMFQVRSRLWRVSVVSAVFTV